MSGIAQNFRFPRWIWLYVFTAFVMTIAVVVFMWQASESRRQAGEGRTASSRPAPMREIPDERIELLARFEPPAYEAAAAEPAPFQAAMKRYSDRDYSRAIPALRVVIAAHPDSIGAHFYLGICLMLTHERAAGVRELEDVIGSGQTPYLERARFYTAKGLLGERDMAGAEQQLHKIIEKHGVLDREAAVLLAQIVPTP